VRRDAVLLELEELAVAVPLRGRRTIDFDPKLHPRDRLGQFSRRLGGILQAGRGSEARLPHGVTVRRTIAGLEVAAPGREPRRYAGPEGAAGEALFLLGEERIKRGEDADRVRSELKKDLKAARKASLEILDQDRLSQRENEVRLAARGKHYPARPAVRQKRVRRPYNPQAVPNLLRSFEASRGAARGPLRSIGALEDERKMARVLAGIEGDAERETLRSESLRVRSGAAVMQRGLPGRARPGDEADADWLRGIYGDNPQEVGLEDGTEDDFGDLINDTLVRLGVSDPTALPEETWERVQDAAGDSQATTMEQWIHDIRYALREPDPYDEPPGAGADPWGRPDPRTHPEYWTE
jgi:hypothetical protein